MKKKVSFRVGVLDDVTERIKWLFRSPYRCVVEQYAFMLCALNDDAIVYTQMV